MYEHACRAGCNAKNGDNEAIIQQHHSYVTHVIIIIVVVVIVIIIIIMIIMIMIMIIIMIIIIIMIMIIIVVAIITTITNVNCTVLLRQTLEYYSYCDTTFCNYLNWFTCIGIFISYIVH